MGGGKLTAARTFLPLRSSGVEPGGAPVRSSIDNLGAGFVNGGQGIALGV